MERIKIDFSFETDEKLLKEMLDKYHNCPKAVKHCKSLGIPDEVIADHISLVNDFVNDLTYCDNCPGVNKCAKNNPTVIRVVTYNNGRIDGTLTPCKKALQKYTQDRQFSVSDFPSEWKENGYDVQYDKTQARYQAVLKLTNWLKGESNEWIYLNGSAGTGRSYFAFCLASMIAKKEKGPIAFINCPNRIRELNDRKFDSDFNSTLDFYSTVPVLVLDDFGNEFKNDFIRDAIITQIMNNRASKKLMTIFTSDFSIDEIGMLYSANSKQGKAATLMSDRIVKTIKGFAKKEISLGEMSVY